MNDNQPGQLISPQGPEDPKPSTPGGPEPDRPTEGTEPNTVPSPVPSPESSSVAAQAVSNPQPAQPDSNWQFTQSAAATSEVPREWGDITWTAAEFIEHEKSFGWYAALALVGVVVAALAYLISHDKITTGVILLVMLGFGIAAARRPRTQQYRLSPGGLQIGGRAYSFHEFRTFSVTEDGSIVSIVFTPLKRFMPALTIYVAPDIEEQVVGFLSAFLPFERHKADAVDSLMRRIRF